MQIYVLTRKDGSRSTPVGTTSLLSIADQWTANSPDNDYFLFELDALAHLGFEANGPAFNPAPALPFDLPPVPEIDENDPAATLKSLSGYLKGLVSSFENVQGIVRT